MRWYLDKDQNGKALDESKRRTLMLDKAKAMQKLMQTYQLDAKRYEALFQKRAVARDNIKALADDMVQEHGVIRWKRDNYDYNIIRQNVTAATNQIISSRPKPTFVTEDAEQTTIEISKKLEKHVLKIFKKKRLYKLGPKAFRDAALMKIGLIKIIWEKGEYKFIKVHPRKFACGNPYSNALIPEECVEEDFYDPYELCEKFPSKKKEIEENYITGKDTVDPIQVYEIYKAKKKKAIFCEKITFLEKAWEFPFVPYQIFKWQDATEGVLGMCIGDELEGLQNTLMDLIDRICDNYRRVGNAKIFVSKQSGVRDEDMTDEIGIVVRYNQGTDKPITDQPPLMNEQYFTFPEILYQKSFEMTGNNPINVTGDLPKGLNQASGIALRTHTEIDSKKFQDIRSDYEDCYLEITRKILLLGGKDALPKDDKDFQAIDLEAELEKMDLYAGSLFPSTPAGQLANALDLMKNGAFSKDQVLSMIDHQDIKKHIGSIIERRAVIDWLIEDAISKEEKPQYFSQLGLDVYFDRARFYFARTIKKRGPDDKYVAKLGEFVDELEAKYQNAQKFVEDSVGA